MEMNSHRCLSNCNRHPEEQVTGFCASCLRERLAGLDNANSCRSSAAIKTLFFRPATSTSSQRQNGRSKNIPTSSLFRPELRRCKSFASRPHAAAAAIEPQRKSCDVRVRSTLSSLFHQDDRDQFLPSSSTTALEDSVGVAEASKNDFEDVRPIKDHIDLEESYSKKIPSRDIKEIAGSFWLAASILSKKLQKWRRKNKPDKTTADEGGIRKQSAFRRAEKKNRLSSHRYRETQSEIGVDSLGRRSCEIDPRLSLDAGRISFEEQRYSLDEPRASWDGFLINNGRSLGSRFPSKRGIVEDDVERYDGLIPVEEDTKTPGCSAQTREYYSDSFSRRRRSIDRCSSSRRHSVETKPSLNSSGFDSVRVDCSGSVKSTSRDSVDINPVKKSRFWSIWGFINRRNENRAGENHVMERSISETWPEIRVTGTRIERSNSSLSCARRSFSTINGKSSTQKSRLETNVHKTKKNKRIKKKELVLDKSRSARYSPSHFDHGLLRFYLTPTRGSWRSGILAKGKFSSPRSLASSILRFY